MLRGGARRFFRCHQPESIRANLLAAARTWLKLRSQSGRSLGDEDWQDELAEFGIDEDAAEDWIAAADEADAEEEELETCYVLPANAHTVHVFLGCQFNVIAGAERAVFTGIPPSEVLAVCDLLNVPQPERANVLFGVRLMANEVLPELNSRG